jgi:hypothetical protein
MTYYKGLSYNLPGETKENNEKYPQRWAHENTE